MKPRTKATLATIGVLAATGAVTLVPALAQPRPSPGVGDRPAKIPSGIDGLVEPLGPPAPIGTPPSDPDPDPEGPPVVVEVALSPEPVILIEVTQRVRALRPPDGDPAGPLEWRVVEWVEWWPLRAMDRVSAWGEGAQAGDEAPHCEIVWRTGHARLYRDCADVLAEIEHGVMQARHSQSAWRVIRIDAGPIPAWMPGGAQ